MEIGCVVICINVVVIINGMRRSYSGIMVVLSSNNVVVFMGIRKRGCGIYFKKCRPNSNCEKLKGDTCNNFHMWMS